MQLKKKIVQFIFVAIMSFSLGFYSGDMAVKRTTKSTSTIADSPKEQEKYMLRLWDDRIWLYEFVDSKWQPSICADDIEPLSLREEDYNALNEGIETSDKQMLLSMIEDFSS